MKFLAWHYTEGFSYYLRRWIYSLRYIEHYFSLPVLVRTLFYPWKRLESDDTGPGFSISRYFENLSFNLISRLIGAIVKVILILSGLFMIAFVFIGGGLGFLVWALIPPFGIPPYLRHQQSPDKLMKTLLERTRQGPDPYTIFFSSGAGKFLLTHLGVSLEDFKKVTNLSAELIKIDRIKNLEDIIEWFIDKGVWTENDLKKYRLVYDDLLRCAKWWDSDKERGSELKDDHEFGRPGIGVDLMFGYTPVLSQYSIDLSRRQSFSHRLIGRDDVVERMDRVLSQGSSLILSGQPGVGKKTVVLEFAQKSLSGSLSEGMSYKRVLEFDYNVLLSGEYDLNQKKARLAQIFSEASMAGNIILFIKDIHRLTNAEVEGYDFTDVFEEYLEKRNLKVIVSVTPIEYERFISINMRLRKYFETVEVKPVGKTVALEIMVEAAKNWEYSSKVVVTIPAMRKILDESDKYITDTPFPEKALELLDAVVTYRNQKGGGVVSYDDASVVLSEKTGISFKAITHEEKQRLINIEEIIHQRLVNQKTAVDLIAKSLRGRSVGAVKEERPMGSFLFLGPTGVGKTETAKVLARVYYGEEKSILRFDMADYAGREGFERLIGSVSSNLPGALTTAIKNKPASLLLLDEIEKATRDINNLFLTLLDEGTITDALGRSVSGRHLFVIATSNAGAEFVRELVSKGVSGEALQKETVEYVLKKNYFSPEFLNRFDGVVVYEPLNHEHLVQISKLILEDLGKSLSKKDITLEIRQDTAEKLATEGYEPAFGARPIRRIVDLYIADIIGKAILEDKITAGDRISIFPTDKKLEFYLEKVS
ncbi:MAG: clp protease ATP binding subunit [Candidatus Woesebacteria bacterium GW2011_GWA1_39_21]|uniref:Clp protease ATP binding subunit n=1 Tax=Candidatus Woesebacteria bacterium GW2011_GWA1_39_21 TaxID=1618550 RepID=A0A0G0NC93_9BACT|nr:MAG: clp protease ATP binding subunit [Candidatus Woesebacteria bacterium GW2011_GWA1_39_21]